jgi:hypothetical protein
METTFDSTYDAYVIVATGITVSASNANVRMRMKIGGTYKTGNFYEWVTQLQQTTTYRGSSSAADSSINISGGIGTGVNYSAQFTLHLGDPTSTNLVKMAYWTGSVTSANPLVMLSGAGVWDFESAALTGIRFFPSAGTLITGEFRLYGIAK